MFKNVQKEEIIIPAQMVYLKQVREFIEHIGRKYKFTDRVTNSFKLVVDEACTNIIRHGYRDIKNGQIIIRAIIRKLSLTIVIIDHGKSFDPRQVKNPDLQKYVSIGKKGGLGIFMMRKLMDDIKYNVTNRGNELRLTKVREKVEHPKILMIWDSLTLRTKFTLVTCAIITALSIFSFIYFNSKIEQNITRDIFTTSQALSENLAKISFEPFNDHITLTENAKSVKETRPDIITMTLVTDSVQRPKTTYPYRQDLILKGLRGETIYFGEQKLIDTLNQTKIYRYVVREDSILYDFVTPVRVGGIKTRPLGYAHILVNEFTIKQRISRSRLNLLLLLIIVLLVGRLDMVPLMKMN